MAEQLSHHPGMGEIVRTSQVYQRSEWLLLDVHRDPHGLWGRFSGKGSNENLQYLYSFCILKYLFCIFLRCFFIVDEENGLLFALMSSLSAFITIIAELFAASLCGFSRGQSFDW
jgi:hypothetical protein